MAGLLRTKHKKIIFNLVLFNKNTLPMTAASLDRESAVLASASASASTGATVRISSLRKQQQNTHHIQLWNQTEQQNHLIIAPCVCTLPRLSCQLCGHQHCFLLLHPSRDVLAGRLWHRYNHHLAHVLHADLCCRHGNRCSLTTPGMGGKQRRTLTHYDPVSTTLAWFLYELVLQLCCRQQQTQVKVSYHHHWPPCSVLRTPMALGAGY